MDPNLLANCDEQQRDVASESYICFYLSTYHSIYFISIFLFLLSLPPCFRPPRALQKKPKPEIQKGPPRIQHDFVDRQICEYLVTIALKLHNYPKKTCLRYVSRSLRMTSEKSEKDAALLRNNNFLSFYSFYLCVATRSVRDFFNGFGMMKYCKVNLKRDAKTEFMTLSQAPSRITIRRQTAAVDEAVEMEDLLDRQPTHNMENQAAGVVARRHTVEERVIDDIHGSPRRPRNGYTPRDDVGDIENSSLLQNAEPARFAENRRFEKQTNPQILQSIPYLPHHISQRSNARPLPGLLPIHEYHTFLDAPAGPSTNSPGDRGLHNDRPLFDRSEPPMSSMPHVPFMSLNHSNRLNVMPSMRLEPLAPDLNRGKDEFQDAPAGDRGIQFRHHTNGDQNTDVPNLLTHPEAFVEYIRNILHQKENTNPKTN